MKVFQIVIFINESHQRCLLISLEDINKILDVTKDQYEHALDLHKKSIVCDSLTFDPAPFSEKMIHAINKKIDSGKSLEEIKEKIGIEFARDGFLRVKEIVQDLKARNEYTETWNRSGVTAGSVTLNAPNKDRAVKSIALYTYKFDNLGDVIVKATKAQDIKKAKEMKKHAVLWNFQNAQAIGGGTNLEDELENVEFFYDLGVRTIQLTYNLRNFLGDGCTERYQSGLSDFGIEIVGKMNELGMLIDLSHCGYQTMMDAMETSKQPVACTHTACKPIYDHPRNKTDEQLQVLAEKNGYAGICLVPFFLAKDATLKHFLDHVDHAVKIMGINHVGIGTDTYERFPDEPEKLVQKQNEERNWWDGWRPGKQTVNSNLWPHKKGAIETWENWPYLTVGLASRGYSDEEIQKIIGGNYLKILERVIG